MVVAHYYKMILYSKKFAHKIHRTRTPREGKLLCITLRKGKVVHHWQAGSGYLRVSDASEASSANRLPTTGTNSDLDY